MTRKAYCSRQIRLIQRLARKLGTDANTAAQIWCRNGYAVRWAIKHRHEIREEKARA